MKKSIIRILLFLALSSQFSLIAQTAYSFNKAGNLLDEAGKSLLIQSKYDGESDLRKKYPEVIALGSAPIQNNYDISFVFKQFPFVLWDVDFEFETEHGDFGGTLEPRWIFLRNPRGNKIKFTRDNYFEDIYRDPPEDFAVDLLGKLQLNRNQSYDEVLRLIIAGKIEYELRVSFDEIMEIFIDFSQTLLIKIKFKDYLFWYRLLFNKDEKFMALSYLGYSELENS